MAKGMVNIAAAMERTWKANSKVGNEHLDQVPPFLMRERVAYEETRRLMEEHADDDVVAEKLPDLPRKMYENDKKTGGTLFLGRDEKTWGKEGTGWVDYDPDFECGGPEGTPHRQCAYELTEKEAMGLPLSGPKGRLIHLNVASFRDPLCPRTLYFLFTKARRPKKLRVRVLQQNDPEVDLNCLKAYCEMYVKQTNGTVPAVTEDNIGGEVTEAELQQLEADGCPYVRQVFLHHVHAKEAKGPTWARALLSEDTAVAYRAKDVSPQDFCMSTDSHMDFVPEWDDKMVEMWDMAANEYAVLSTYVAAIETLTEEKTNNLEVPNLCMVVFTSNVRTHATKCARNLPKPKLTNAIWGAGLSFSKCHAELKVPVDPYTPYVFDGEEFNRAARFWTHGYDIYTPHRVYVVHDYHKSQSNPVMHTWSHTMDRDARRAADVRLKTMIDVPGGEKDEALALRMKRSKYGIGDRRSLDQLIQFSGIGLRDHAVTVDGVNRCGNLQWVPFTPHPEGVNRIPTFDAQTEDPLEEADPGSVWFGTNRHEAEKKKGRKLRGKDDDAAATTGTGDALELESGHKPLAPPPLNVDDGAEEASSSATLSLSKPHGGLVNPSLFSNLNPSEHGIHRLPLPIQMSVTGLILGVIAAIAVGAKTGRVSLSRRRVLMGKNR